MVLQCRRRVGNGDLIWLRSKLRMIKRRVFFKEMRREITIWRRLLWFWIEMTKFREEVFWSNLASNGSFIFENCPVRLKNMSKLTHFWTQNCRQKFISGGGGSNSITPWTAPSHNLLTLVNGYEFMMTFGVLFCGYNNQHYLYDYN